MVTTSVIGPSSPSTFCEAPAGLSLFSQWVRTDAHYEHSGVHAASKRQFILAKPTLANPTLANFSTDFGQSWA